MSEEIEEFIEEEVEEVEVVEDDPTALTDEELDILMDSKVSEIESLTGLAIKPKHRRQVESHFHGDMIRLEFYPVMDFNRLLIDDTCVCPKHYNINMDLGIIYLDQIYKGSVIVEYISGQKDEFIDKSQT